MGNEEKGFEGLQAVKLLGAFFMPSILANGGRKNGSLAQEQP